MVTSSSLSGWVWNRTKLWPFFVRSHCSGPISFWHSTSPGGQKNPSWLRDLLLGLWYFIWGQRLQSPTPICKIPITFPYRFVIDAGLWKLHGFVYVDVQHMHLVAVSAVCMPGLYLEKTLESQIWSCVEAAGLGEEGSLAITTEGLIEAWRPLVLRILEVGRLRT